MSESGEMCERVGMVWGAWCTGGEAGFLHSKVGKEKAGTHQVHDVAVYDVQVDGGQGQAGAARDLGGGQIHPKPQGQSCCFLALDQIGLDRCGVPHSPHERVQRWPADPPARGGAGRGGAVGELQRVCMRPCRVRGGPP